MDPVGVRWLSVHLGCFFSPHTHKLPPRSLSSHEKMGEREGPYLDKVVGDISVLTAPQGLAATHSPATTFPSHTVMPTESLSSIPLSKAPF